MRHEWIGTALGLALLVHITLHWNWVVRTTTRLFRKTPGRDTIRWANNLFLMLSMTICIASGRLVIVAIAALVIVAGGWGLKQYDPIGSYFQKDPPPDGVAGEETDQLSGTDDPPAAPPAEAPKPDEAEARPGDESDHPPKEDDVPRDENAAGDETVHTEGKDDSFERWPTPELADLAHASRFMIPIVATVVIVDTIRRRRRRPTRVSTSPTPI